MNFTEAIDFLQDKYGKFDIIIDDGSHWGKHQLFFLKNYNRLLRKNGVLFCEDVKTKFIELFREVRDELGLYILDTRYNRINITPIADDDTIIIRRNY